MLTYLPKGTHNLTTANQKMQDPVLTPHGEHQCLDLRAHFPSRSSVSLLVTSPLRRTIQTTLLAFDPEVSRGISCIALPEVQETSGLPCDTGSNLSALKEDFKEKPIDFSLVPEDWNSNKGKWAPNSEAIDARCRDARKWLKARNEETIVVVAHGGLMHYLTEDWSDTEKFYGRK